MNDSNHYTTIEYQIFIDEKAGVIEIKTKMQANLELRKMGENREKIVFVISRNKRKLPH